MDISFPLLTMLLLIRICVGFSRYLPISVELNSTLWCSSESAPYARHVSKAYGPNQTHKPAGVLKRGYRYMIANSVWLNTNECTLWCVQIKLGCVCVCQLRSRRRKMGWNRRFAQTLVRCVNRLVHASASARILSDSVNINPKSFCQIINSVVLKITNFGRHKAISKNPASQRRLEIIWIYSW